MSSACIPASAYRDGLHGEPKLVGEEAEGEGAGGADGREVDAGQQAGVALRRHHLQRQVGSVAV